jgi:hypothetical protein
MDLKTGNSLDIEYRPAGMVKYVRHNEIAEHLRAGWAIRDDMQNTHHGRHAVLMIYTGPDNWAAD